jgi:selenocysteine lyase/cysteine desulfurase
MIAFQVILPITLDQLRAFLWDHHRIEIGLNQHESLGLLMRISCHFFTTHEEIMQLAAALLDLENRGIA